MLFGDSASRCVVSVGLVVGSLLATGSWLIAAEQTSKPVCADDNGGLTLPPGFCATVFADRVGHARHLVVAPNGVVYVNTPA